MGPEDPRSRRSAPCWRSRRRLPPPASSRPSASPSSAGRARRPPREAQRGRPVLARRDVCLRRALPAGRHPAGLVIDGLAPVVHGLVGDHMPAQLAVPWLSIVPIAEARSSYNGLLVFLFIASRPRSRPSPSIAWPRARCGALRLGIAAFPIASPLTQYTAGSFAQPIRRVFGTIVFRAREHVRHAAARRSPAGAAARSSCAISSGRRSMRRSPAPSMDRRRPSQPPAVPDHPALSQPRLRALVVLLLVLAIWP